MIVVLVKGPDAQIERCDHQGSTVPIEDGPAGAERCTGCGVSWFEADRRRPVYQLVQISSEAGVRA